MKKIIAVICILPLLFMSHTAVAAGFSDVKQSAWYYKSVSYASDSGIVSGRGGGVFDPGGSLSIAEAVKLAAGIHGGNKLSEDAGEFWYDVYFDYAQSTGIITEIPDDPNLPVTRAKFAEFIYRASGELAERNSIADGEIRDVSMGSGFAEAVYSLYRAGILTGSDEFGRFFPERTLTRAEACEIIMRVLMPAERKYVKLGNTLGSEEIFRLCSEAVFSIETFDSAGNSIRTGSGFFISSDGLAVTNLHVLEKARTARITTLYGETYYISEVLAYSAENNVAVMRVSGEDFPWIPVKSSDDVKTGQDVYSIGNPLGLEGTISKGIVSYVGRENSDRVFIQFTANISQGSGGGALVDSRGYIIGITSSSFTGGTALNLATPSSSIIELLSSVENETTEFGDIIHAESY